MLPDVIVLLACLGLIVTAGAAFGRWREQSARRAWMEQPVRRCVNPGSRYTPPGSDVTFELPAPHAEDDAPLSVTNPNRKTDPTGVDYAELIARSVPPPPDEDPDCWPEMAAETLRRPSDAGSGRPEGDPHFSEALVSGNQGAGHGLRFAIPPPPRCSSGVRSIPADAIPVLSDVDVEDLIDDCACGEAHGS